MIFSAAVVGLTLLAQTPQVQVPPPKPLDIPLTPQQLQHPYEVPTAPMPGVPGPENLKSWAPSCRRLHNEVNKCENGLKSCNQRLVERWRRKCERDEPHAE